MVDRHVVKMIVESAQLLSIAHRVLDNCVVEKLIPEGKTRKTTRYVIDDSREHRLYKATHINHPSAVWCRQSIENYNWLVEHFHALMNEYTYRYEKKHKCAGDLAFMLSSPPMNLKEYDWTTMPSCMDQKYIIGDDPIINYRNYYKIGKKHIHSWKKRQPPHWILGE